MNSHLLRFCHGLSIMARQYKVPQNWISAGFGVHYYLLLEYNMHLGLPSKCSVQQARAVQCALLNDPVHILSIQYQRVDFHISIVLS